MGQTQVMSPGSQIFQMCESAINYVFVLVVSLQSTLSQRTRALWLVCSETLVVTSATMIYVCALLACPTPPRPFYQRTNKVCLKNTGNRLFDRINTAALIMV